MTRIITIASAKGGVGKTTTCANLATAISKQGKDVIAVDGNLTTSNLGLHLGIPLYPITLQDVLKGKVGIKDAVYGHPAGFRIIPADISFSKVMCPKGKDFFHSFYRLTGDTDFILIDSAAGLGKEAKAAIEGADELITVTNPEMPALTDALKLVKMADKHGTENLGVVVNRVTGARYEVPINDVVDFLELPLLGVVHEDPAIKSSIGFRQPVVLHKPRSRAAYQFNSIAARLTGAEEPVNRQSAFHRLFGWLID